jgi:hypothetical protein
MMEKVSSLFEKKTSDDYLHFYISEAPTSKRYESLLYDGENNIISSGIYISPFAQSILASNQIDALILDTTFRLLPNYVTSIMFGVFPHTGVPLAFSFKKNESNKTYHLFFDVFQTHFHITLNDYPILSDQGSSLVSICLRFNLKNYFCIWHLLHGFGYKQVTFEISLLVKASSQKEL